MLFVKVEKQIYIICYYINLRKSISNKNFKYLNSYLIQLSICDLFSTLLLEIIT